MDYNKILEVAPLLQSAMLLDQNVNLFKKKKKKAGDFIGVGVGTIIGAEFIKAESDIIKGI